MKKLLTTTFAVGCLLALPIGSMAQSDNTPKTHISHSELKKLQREATSPAQFKLLADYYRQRQREFNAKAADEKIEWERRSRDVSGPMAKPPRPVDSARNLYEYYQYEADQAAKLAVQYEEKAGKHAPEGAAA